MPLVYIDTNVVDVFLRQSPVNLACFRRIKKKFDIQFCGSVDLLAELVGNPNREAAKESLRIVKELCSPCLFLLEPKFLLQNEVKSFFRKELPQLYCSRSEAISIFEQFWGNIVPERAGGGSPWLKGLKKKKFLEEKKDYAEVLREIKNLSSSYDFRDIYAAATASGYLQKFIEGLLSGLMEESVSPERLEVLTANLKKLPIIHSYLLHDLAYFMFYGLKGRRLSKHGNIIDARHAVMASTSDYFLSRDADLIEMLGYAKDYWKFEPISPEQFCDKYRA